MFGKIRRAGCRRLADTEPVLNLPPTLNGEDEINLPPSPEEVKLVQCEKFRCLAYRDKHGKWRSPFSKMELPRVIHVIELGPD